jgi:hypothetical protein
MRKWLLPDLQPFVSVLYLEDMVSKLRQSVDPKLSAYFDAYARKYLRDG